MGKPKDLTGQRFGRLTVVRQAGKNKQGNYMWFCQCDCGNTCTVVGSNFSRKNRPTKSCGCLAKEINSEKMKKQNEEWWQDEDYREKKIEQASEQMKKKWQEDEEFREKQADKFREWWQDEEFRKMKSEKRTIMNYEMWQDEEFRNTHSGENHVAYNHDLTDEDRQDRRCQKGYAKWVDTIKEQADYTCNCCGDSRDKSNLVSHHLNGYDWCKERRIDVTNGVCLCEGCHKEFHHIYGYGGNTEEQYEEFKMNKQNTDSKVEDVA